MIGELIGAPARILFLMFTWSVLVLVIAEFTRQIAIAGVYATQADCLAELSAKPPALLFANAAPFVEFMLDVILRTIKAKGVAKSAAGGKKSGKKSGKKTED